MGRRISEAMAERKIAFFGEMGEAAHAALPDASVRTKSLVVAHAALESGWGISDCYRLGKNPFNLLLPDADTTSNCLAILAKRDGQVRLRRFALYPSYGAAIEAYLKTLGPRRAQLMDGDEWYALPVWSEDGRRVSIDGYRRDFLVVLDSVTRLAQALHAAKRRAELK